MSCLVLCLWWTSVVGTAWLTAIFLEALPHISFFHSRSCPDPAHLASVIGPEDELILCGPKSFSRTFCAHLELREMEVLSFWKSVKIWSLSWPYSQSVEEENLQMEIWSQRGRIRGRGRETWWNESLAPMALVKPLPILDLGSINSPFFLTSSNWLSIICNQKSPVQFSNFPRTGAQ